MRYFHVLVVGLLVIIAFDLSVVAMKLPTSDAQAQTRSPGAVPAPALQDPHDAIKADISQVRREVAALQQETATLRQQVTGIGQQNDQTGKIVYQSAQVLTGTCTFTANLLRDLDSQRFRDLVPPTTRGNVCQVLR